jgi:hypothetical protein
MSLIQIIRQSIEYISDTALVNELSNIVLDHGVRDGHMRVRAIAWKALNQMAGDQAPEYQERNHVKVFDALLTQIEAEKVNRVRHC